MREKMQNLEGARTGPCFDGTGRTCQSVGRAICIKKTWEKLFKKLVSGLHTGSPASELMEAEPGNLYVNCSLGDSNTP